MPRRSQLRERVNSWKAVRHEDVLDEYFQSSIGRNNPESFLLGTGNHGLTGAHLKRQDTEESQDHPSRPMECK